MAYKNFCSPLAEQFYILSLREVAAAYFVTHIEEDMGYSRHSYAADAYKVEVLYFFFEHSKVAILQLNLDRIIKEF